jgi:hypothetical protein
MRRLGKKGAWCWGNDLSIPIKSALEGGTYIF